MEVRRDPYYRESTTPTTPRSQSIGSANKQSAENSGSRTPMTSSTSPFFGNARRSFSGSRIPTNNGSTTHQQGGSRLPKSSSFLLNFPFDGAGLVAEPHSAGGNSSSGR